MSKYELAKTLLTGKNYQAPPVRGKRERIGPDFRILLGSTAALAGMLAIKAGMLGCGADAPKHVDREFGGEPPKALVKSGDTAQAKDQAKELIKVGEHMKDGNQVPVSEVVKSMATDPELQPAGVGTAPEGAPINIASETVSPQGSGSTPDSANPR